ncbi:hypothetical protein NDU88_002528 [Pleurodeles waltl]|uniref:Uncharacterized protein n=1 Tax=Pleurodeles waltl TaxID=8319 RepID=A0AAV7NHY3_PLEWA|nr:hypothetical protein NDU88_002528 [Pleurodeles waltl]
MLVDAVVIGTAGDDVLDGSVVIIKTFITSLDFTMDIHHRAGKEQQMHKSLGHEKMPPEIGDRHSTSSKNVEKHKYAKFKDWETSASIVNDSRLAKGRRPPWYTVAPEMPTDIFKKGRFRYTVRKHSAYAATTAGS